MSKTILFVSKNEDKKKEIQELFKKEKDKRKGKICFEDIDVQDYGDVEEEERIQTKDIEKLVRRKVLYMYEKVKRPVIVEHTALNIAALNGLPNTCTALFWEAIGEKGLLKLMKRCSDRKAEACTLIGYCDGKNVIIGKGKVEGEIISGFNYSLNKKKNKTKNVKKFGWDAMFIPKSIDSTNKLSFEELNSCDQKNMYSMRRMAMEDLFDKIQEKYTSSTEFETELFDVGIDPDVVADIAKKAKEGKLVLFIGSGISCSVKMASIGQVRNTLAKRLAYDKDVFSVLGDYLALSEYYEHKKGDLTDVICDNFMSVDMIKVGNEIKHSRIYQLLTQLPVDTIYTTNYEDLIEKAYRIHATNKTALAVYDIETYNKASHADVKVIKLHGDLMQQENIVLTQASYYKRYSLEHPLDILLRRDLLDKTFLFLGYSFNDDNVEYMFYKLNQVWGEYKNKNKPKSYIFIPENNPVRRVNLKKSYNIHSVVSNNLDRTAGTIEFLQAIVEQLKKL